MTNRKTTRRALVLSLLSLLVCCSMLVGTTFAWFTDSVQSGNNKIIAGNLDVELEYANSPDGNYTSVVGVGDVFVAPNGATKGLWEPGHTEVAYLKIHNAGTLNLKYQLRVVPSSETVGFDADGKEIKLSKILKFAATEPSADPIATAYTRQTAQEAALKGNGTALTEYTKNGDILAPGASEYVALVVYMPEEVGNEANYRGTAVPTINFALELLATQVVAENDSFDNKYDAGAEYLPKWDGTPGELPPADNDGVIIIDTAEELAAFAAAVNGTSTFDLRAAATGESFAGKTVKLAADINLANKPWTPIGACDGPAYFQGTFDGQGHTIYGLNVDNSADGYMYSTSGLFGWIDAAKATIKNVNISGATVKGSHWVGGLVGYMTGTVENCSVVDSTIVGVHVNDDADGDKIGGLVGFLNNGALIGNTVADTTVSANRDVGGLVGSVTAGQTLTNNTVKNLTVTYVTEKSYASAGEIVSGRTGFAADASNTAANVLITKGTLAADGVVEVAAKSYEVTSKEGLLNVNKIIAETATGEGRGIKVKLLADIDLAGETWKPIDKMWVDFDGNGHTISNLKAQGWRAGLFGYLGGGSIKNLTLKNVNVTGAQAGTFAGAAEGKIENCTLKGDNIVTWAEKHQYDDPNAGLETWGGIGAITGILQPMTVNATIAEGATVTLNYGAIVTEAPYVDQLTGYIGTNKGTIVNNGKIIVAKTVSSAADLKATSASGANITLSGVVDLGGEKDNYLNLSKDTTITGGTIKGTGWTGELNYAVNASSGNIVFDGVTFDTTDWSTVGWAGWGISVNVNGTANVTFKNCTFKGTQCPIYQSGAESVITLENCKFENTTVAIQCEIYSGDFSLGQDLIVKGCDFTGLADVLHIYDYDKNPTTEDIVAYLTNNGNTFTGVCKQTCN